MIRFFNKITKGIILVFGFIILVIITAVGAVGLHYKDTAESFYSSSRKLAMDSLATVKNSVNGIKDQLQSGDNELSTSIDGAKSSIDVSINTLKELKDSMSSSGDTQTTNKIQSLIDDLTSVTSEIDVINGNVSKTLAGASDAVDAVLRSPIYDSIMNLANNLPTDDEFKTTYGSIAIGLTAAGGSILGIYVLSIVFGFVFFKRDCGFRVRRFHKRNDLVNHVNKIFEKHPEIYDEFYSQH